MMSQIEPFREKIIVENKSNLICLAKNKPKRKSYEKYNQQQKRENFPASQQLGYLFKSEGSNHFPDYYGIYLEITEAGFGWLADVQANFLKSLPTLGEMAAKLTFAEFVLPLECGVNLTHLKWTDNVKNLYPFNFADFISINLSAEFLEKNEDETPLQSGWRVRLEPVGEAAAFQFFNREKWSQEEVYSCSVLLNSLLDRTELQAKSQENQPTQR